MSILSAKHIREEDIEEFKFLGLNWYFVNKYEDHNLFTNNLYFTRNDVKLSLTIKHNYTFIIDLYISSDYIAYKSKDSNMNEQEIKKYFFDKVYEKNKAIK